jgi:hypothetical protein
MRTPALLTLLAACASEPRARTATFPPVKQPIIAIAEPPPFVVKPGYVGSDVDLASLPHAPVTERIIPLRHAGPRTSFRFDDGVSIITASNDSVEGLRLEASRNGAYGCMVPPPPIHRTRALTQEEWRHLVWLVNIAEVERLPPWRIDLMEAMVGVRQSTFVMSSPEGDAEVSARADDVHYVIAYMFQLAGDGFD